MTLLDFIAGGVFSRDGSIFQDNGKPRVEFTDINGDGNKELIVSQLTAGSGNYLRVDAFSLGPDSINKVLSIQSDTKSDYISLLKELCEICLPIDAPHWWFCIQIQFTPNKTKPHNRYHRSKKYPNGEKIR